MIFSKASVAAFFVSLASAQSCAKIYYQCGGSNWNGTTCCEAGLTCKVQNDFYSQCVASDSNSGTYWNASIAHTFSPKPATSVEVVEISKPSHDAPKSSSYKPKYSHTHHAAHSEATTQAVVASDASEEDTTSATPGKVVTITVTAPGKPDTVVTTTISADSEDVSSVTSDDSAAEATITAPSAESTPASNYTLISPYTSSAFANSSIESANATIQIPTYAASTIVESLEPSVITSAPESDDDSETSTAVSSDDVAETSAVSSEDAAETSAATSDAASETTVAAESSSAVVTSVAESSSAVAAETSSAAPVASSAAPDTAASVGENHIGFTPIAGGFSGTGKTTRYWDCCKPSCSWSGKASVSAPVTACKADGVTAADVNAQSGCNGGDAYMCSNQQPFAINSTLAYGFAAASIVGGSESSMCCSCALLTFNDGPASGKQMVIQITNTGSDLSNNHFDIAMPGGGVGIFNGCSNQWNAPTDGWGERYGGVSSESACANLPKQLQSGCDWRWDFLQGSDNPSVSFVEIDCPAEITSISGCKRN